MNSPGDADAAGVGETLKASGDVNAVAVELLTLDHHVAEVDTDAEFHPAFGWQIRVLGPECGLDLDGAFHRIHNAGELRQHAITGGVHEAPAVLLDAGVNDFAIGGKRMQCRLFIFPHEAAIAVYVGAEYGGELTFHALNPRRE